jgi:hypothetical protein
MEAIVRRVKIKVFPANNPQVREIKPEVKVLHII